MLKHCCSDDCKHKYNCDRYISTDSVLVLRGKGEVVNISVYIDCYETVPGHHQKITGWEDLPDLEMENPDLNGSTVKRSVD